MHYLHCILVELEEDNSSHISSLEHEELDEFLSNVRQTALDATEDFEGRVYDWREEDAGRWKSLFPSSVILGAIHPEKFLEELSNSKIVPLEAAKDRLGYIKNKNTEWRTELDLEQNKQFSKLDKSLPSARKDGVILNLSAEITPDPVVSEELLLSIWNTSFHMEGSFLKDIFNLINGVYTTDSCFYSVPDYSSKISKETEEATQKNPEKFALVFLDYHN